MLAALFAGAPARTAGPSAFPRRLHVARLHGRRRLRRIRSRRTDPDFKEVGVAIATIDNDDPSGIDTALIDQVVHGATAEHVCLTCAAGSPGVDDDVSLRIRCVLQ